MQLFEFQMNWHWKYGGKNRMKIKQQEIISSFYHNIPNNIEQRKTMNVSFIYYYTSLFHRNNIENDNVENVDSTLHCIRDVRCLVHYKNINCFVWAQFHPSFDNLPCKFNANPLIILREEIALNCLLSLFSSSFSLIFFTICFFSVILFFHIFTCLLSCWSAVCSSWISLQCNR